jgi:hypothetical protein
MPWQYSSIIKLFKYLLSFLFFSGLDALLKVCVFWCHKYLMENRPLCAVCGKKPAAVNYIKGEKRYYRKRCDGCIRKKKNLSTPIPLWVKSGYKKKLHCEKCGFKARYREQLFVFHVDGNLNNCALPNLKTICANCQIEVAKQGLGWGRGDLTPDL